MRRPAEPEQKLHGSAQWERGEREEKVEECVQQMVEEVRCGKG